MADYEEEGDGGGMWKWIFVAIIAFVVISAIGGVMEDDDASSKPAPIATSTSVPQRNKAADSDAAFFKSIQDLARESGLTQPEVSIPELESFTHQLINSERAKQGLHTLQFDGSIASIARNHSVDMARRGYFSHINPKGQDSTDRGTSVGFDCIKDYGNYYTYGLAENIHQGWLSSSATYVNEVPLHDWNTQQEIAVIAVEDWMNSREHRENILDASYDRTGIGVAIAEDGKVYITQNFC